MKDNLSTSKLLNSKRKQRKGPIGVMNHSCTIRCWSGVVCVVSLDGETKLDEAPLVSALGKQEPNKSFLGDCEKRINLFLLRGACKLQNPSYNI